MAISVISAWLAVLGLVLTALKHVVKRNRKLNRFFRKIHIPAGILLIGAGFIHGLLSGNSSGVSLGEISVGAELFSLNPGTICFVLAIALGLSYCFRRQLKKGWMRIHRVLTVMLIVMLVIHVSQTGITLPALFRTEAVQQPAASQTETSTGETAPETEPSAATAPETVVTAEVTDETAQEMPEQLDITFSGARLRDGTYEGSAEGFKGTIRVSVTVENGAVASVEIVSQSDTPKYWNRAKYLVDTIVNEQSLEVDAVSGATWSSKGILCAVYDALEEAVYDGELQITIPQTSGRKH